MGAFTWDLPFADPAITEFTTALATTRASIPVVELVSPALPLHWTRESMGSLEMAFDAPWLQDPALGVSLEARVRLRPLADPRGESLTLNATWDRSVADGNGGFVLPDVPEGSYEAWLFQQDTGASFPSRHDAGWTVEIMRGQRTHVDATAHKVAGVLLEISKANGEPFERGLSVSLMLKRPQQTSYMCLDKQMPAFAAAPYLFPFVPLDRMPPESELYAILNCAITVPRPALISKAPLKPSQLHKVQLTLEERRR